MSIFHAAIRAALFQQLSALPSLGAPVHSNPPSNIALNHILIGDISAEAPECKDDPSSWYTASIEVWSQTFSPGAMDAVADAVVARLMSVAPTGPGRSFTKPQFTGGQPSAVPDEAGGPLYGRVLGFRFYVD